MPSFVCRNNRHSLAEVSAGPTWLNRKGNRRFHRSALGSNTGQWTAAHGLKLAWGFPGSRSKATEVKKPKDDVTKVRLSARHTLSCWTPLVTLVWQQGQCVQRERLWSGFEDPKGQIVQKKEGSTCSSLICAWHGSAAPHPETGGRSSIDFCVFFS